MPSTPLTDEQKTMIRELPVREKDKLLLRLIKKDDLLLEQLTYEHIEHGSTLELRADEQREYYREQLGKHKGGTPDALMKRMRKASGYLTRHVRVTKDKLGEVSMLTDMLHYALDQNLAPMRKRFRNPNRWYRLAKYVSSRLGPLTRKADKLHPDYWIEFEGQLNDLLLLVHDTPELNGEAERQGVPRRWDGPVE